MPQLLTDCEAFIEEEKAIDSRNFLEMWRVADQMEKPRIAKKVEQFTLDEFAQIHLSSRFRSLPMEYLKKILSSRRLKVHRESEVMDTIIQWIGDEPEKRSELVQLMGEVVRLDQLEGDKLKELAVNRELVFREDGCCLSRIEAALGRRLSPEDISSKMTDEEKKLVQPRDSTVGLLMLAAGPDINTRAYNNLPHQEYIRGVETERAA